MKLTDKVKGLVILLVFVAAITSQLPRGSQIMLGQQSPVSAISAPGSFNQTVTSAGLAASTAASYAAVSGAINLIGTGVEFHKLFQYSSKNAITACTYQLEGSAVSTFATTSLIGSVMTCNTSGAPGLQPVPTAFSQAVQGKFNYVRMHVLSASASSTATISIIYRGYNQDPDFIQAANKQGVLNISSATTTIVVSAGTGDILVTAMAFSIATTSGAAQTVKFGYDLTNTSCASTGGFTAITGAFTGGTNNLLTAGVSLPVIYSIGNGAGVLLRVPGTAPLCAITTGSQNVSGFISYKQNN